MNATLAEKSYFHQRVTQDMKKLLRTVNRGVQETMAYACRILAMNEHEAGLAGQISVRCVPLLRKQVGWRCSDIAKSRWCRCTSTGWRSTKLHSTSTRPSIRSAALGAMPGRGSRNCSRKVEGSLRNCERGSLRPILPRMPVSPVKNAVEIACRDGAAAAKIPRKRS